MNAKHTKYFLVADIGNTQMLFGLYNGEELICDWRLSSSRHVTPDELAWQLHGMVSQQGLEDVPIDGIMVASVVPHLDATISEACERVFEQRPAFLGSSEVRSGIAIDYKNPREVGADRIANAVAAREMFGAPVMVLDCGTATTFDLVSPEGHYAGGLIIPGMEISLQALCQRAAKLPDVSFARQEELIGRDTVSSMQAGSYWAAIESLSGLIRRLKSEQDYMYAPVIATGGLASMIAEDTPEISDYRPHLTLEGLRFLAAKHFI